MEVTSGREEQVTAIVSNGRTSTQVEFSEYGSVILMLYKSEDGYMTEKKHVEILRLQNDFDIVSRDDNAITSSTRSWSTEAGTRPPAQSCERLPSLLHSCSRVWAADFLPKLLHPHLESAGSHLPGTL